MYRRLLQGASVAILVGFAAPAMATGEYCSAGPTRSAACSLQCCGRATCTSTCVAECVKVCVESCAAPPLVLAFELQKQTLRERCGYRAPVTR